MSADITIPIPSTREGYETFIRCKNLPSYRVRGREVLTDPVSYAAVFGGDVVLGDSIDDAPYLMDFQRHIVHRALSRRRFAVWADCGLGKTAMELAWAHAVARHGRVLLLCPLAVLKQIRRECQRWHGHDLVNLRDGEPWTDGIAVLNYESRRDIDMRGVVGIVLDESSILKNDTGETRDWLVGLSAHAEYRMAASATPAPNDHAEYASHAVFLGYARTAKEFYSQYFRKDGAAWRLRGHAIEPFYRNMATWSTYLQSPRSLGFRDTTEMECEPDYLYRQCGLHSGYASRTGMLFADAGVADERSGVFGEIRATRGPRLQAIGEYLDGRRGIVWCARNAEEDAVRGELGTGAIIVNGTMPIEQRVEVVDAYRAGEVRHIVSKPKVLGFGVNLPECDHMVYSGFGYSFEEFYQAVRRAHRYGRQGRLEVMVPYTDPEISVLRTLREKMARFGEDVRAMQSRFWTERRSA